MDKKFKILLVLLAIAISVVLYLIVSTKPVNHSGVDEVKKVDLVKLEKEYKEDVVDIFNDYSALIQGDEWSVRQLEEIKNRLLDLKVPTSLKDLHLNFVLAVVKMESYLQSNEEKDRIDSETLINDLEEDFDWLS